MLRELLHRWFAFRLAALIAALVGCASLARAQEDQGVLASFISKVLSTPSSRVSIGAVEGALSSNATIRNVTVADAQGVYLRIDLIKLVWRRAALLSRRIEIQTLEIGKFELLRKPAQEKTAVSDAPPGPLLPELPLRVEVGKFDLTELSLGESILGVAARFSAAGRASLGAPTEGLQAQLDVRRLDAIGQSTIRLAFAPATEQLDLTVKHDEPAGGIVARLAGLPGLPPVKLDVVGAGKLDDWRAQLLFDAGPGIDARGEARLARAGALRRLGLDLTAHIENLLPPIAAPVFAGATKLTGQTIFNDDGGLSLNDFRLASDLAEMTIEGKLDAARTLDVAVKARALPNEGGATKRGGTSLGQLSLTAAAKGPLAAPIIDGAFNLQDFSSPALKLGAVAATLTVVPANDGGATLQRVSMDARASRIGLADAGLSEAIGGEATLLVRGVVDDKAVADLSDARLATPNLSLSFNGRAGGSVLDGRARAEITKLSAFAKLAQRALAGRATLQAQVRGDPSASRISALLEGNTSDLSLGDAIADRLIGRRATLAGLIGVEPGALRFDRVNARGEYMTVALNGRLADEFNLDGDLSLSDLSKADRRLAGAARVDAKLTGPATDPSASLRINAVDMRALDRPIRNLALTLTAARAISAPDVALTARGDVDGKPLVADIKATGSAAQGWSLNQFAASLGSVVAQGRGRIDARNLATGRFTLQAGDLDDLSPLALMRLSGAVDATLTADAADNRQRIAIDANGRRLKADAITLDTFKTALRVDDLYGRVAVNGDATVDRLMAGAETIERIALTARGSANASDITLGAQARGFDLSVVGKLTPGAAMRFDLASLSATRGGSRIALQSPASLVLENGSVRTERLVIGVMGGGIDIRGKAGADLDLTIEAQRIPLAAIDIVAPNTGLSGMLDARATLKGSAPSLQGSYDATLRGVSAPQSRNAGVPPLDIHARGRLEGDRAQIDATIMGGRIINATISGGAPLTANGAFDLRARGTVDAALANATLAANGQRVAGRIALDGSLRGTRSRPDIQGSAILSGGSFNDPLQGVALTNIEGRVSGRGESIIVDRITARTKNSGSINISGRVEANADRGFPVDLKVAASNAELVSSDLATLTASLNLGVSGPLAAAPRISGRIDVSSLEVRVPDRLPSASEPLRDARHVKPPPQTQARLRQIAKQRAATRRRGGAAFNAALDVTLSAPGRVFVRGRGIDAELGGEVRVSGSSRDPRIGGSFELRRGRLSLLTQRLDFTRGRVTFGGGDIVPDLDFVAETRAAEVTARIAVTGRASEPQFALSSSPDLPQDEVLSRLLFARAAGGLSPFQAVQLAQAVSQLSGGGGPDVFEQTRRALGVDDLDVNMGTAGPTVGISRAINDRVRVGVKAGSKPENSAIGVDIDLTRRLKIQTEIGADGRAAVGVGTELEY